jgi:hypothetical protein
MRIALAGAFLAGGYALWWVMPMVQGWLRLDWAGDFGQLCLVILVLSIAGKALERFLPGQEPRHHDAATPPPAPEAAGAGGQVTS